MISIKVIIAAHCYANADYDDDKKLDPMFTILEKSDCKMQVTQWNLYYAFADNPPEYGILYYGKRSFASSEGIVDLPGDVDGDGEVSGITDFTALDRGGEALGYEVSLYLPQDESVTPVKCYMMEICWNISVLIQLVRMSRQRKIHRRKNKEKKIIPGRSI